MKNLSKLNGAKALSKGEQMSINGGKPIGYNGGKGYFMCAPAPNNVACPTAKMCQQNCYDDWYCAGESSPY